MYHLFYLEKDGMKIGSKTMSKEMKNEVVRVKRYLENTSKMFEE